MPGPAELLIITVLVAMFAVPVILVLAIVLVVTRSKPAWVRCPHCDGRVGPDTRFCPHCGKPMGPEA